LQSPRIRNYHACIECQGCAVTNELSKAVRAAAKGSGWSVKWDILSKRINEHALAVHPRRGIPRIVEFRAKPCAWDNLLWSILQIEGNEKKPVSFHFTGAFICDTPAIVQENIEMPVDNEKLAQQMVNLSRRCLQMASTWQGYDLDQAIAKEQPQEPYRYHTTRVLERICSGDRQAARDICAAALQGDLDLRHRFHSVDKLMPPDADGRRPFLSFFQLAQLWMSRH
ncbi:hypothetical protein, partial [Paracoccus sp. (in: a-proteobacteria)]|uniref:hypothetical protein n=1 Tax=Paracoccus sp. TaxID=267 RepID=UPI0035B39D2F